MKTRNTIQKALVYAAVNESCDHPSAETLYDRIAKNYPTISRGTVYRNLGQLCENGEVRRVEIPGTADRYDLRTGDHYHFCCEKCGRVLDMPLDYIGALDATIADGLRIHTHEILFRGLCPDCST